MQNSLRKLRAGGNQAVSACNFVRRIAVSAANKGKPIILCCKQIVRAVSDHDGALRLRLLQKIRQNPLLTGVTFSGGEPFLQCAPLAELAKEIHAMGLDIWSYSGYTLEELRARHDEATNALLAEIDVLVDGAYIEELRDLTLHFRGSSNQRVIDMNATRKQGKVVLLYED